MQWLFLSDSIVFLCIRDENEVETNKTNTKTHSVNRICCQKNHGCVVRSILNACKSTAKLLRVEKFKMDECRYVSWNMSKVKVLLAHHSLKPKNWRVALFVDPHYSTAKPIYDTILIYCWPVCVLSYKCVCVCSLVWMAPKEKDNICLVCVSRSIH